MTTEEEIAAALPEPPNGARVLVEDSDREMKAIFRDDSAVVGDYPTERWFSGTDDMTDGMDFYQHVKYAQAIYVCGEPTVVLGG